MSEIADLKKVVESLESDIASGKIQREELEHKTKELEVNW